MNSGIIIDYYMAFFILHVISTRDAHISPRAERPRVNMGRELIWHVMWKMPYHNLFIISFNASFHIFVRADRFQKPWLDMGYDAIMSYYIYVFIPSPTKLRRDIVTLPSVRPSHPCEHSRINILQWILIKLGTYLVLKRIWNPFDFQGQMSRSQGQFFTA